MMPKLMIVTSAFLFWAFYEMSGGADFEPPERPVVVAEVPAETPEPAIETPILTVVDVAEPAAEPQIENAVFVTEVIIEPAPAVATLETEEPETAQTPMDIRWVSGEWVNMRGGPGTSFGVLDTLPRGTQAEILSVNADGWAQIRLIEADTVGWMAERLLSRG